MTQIGVATELFFYWSLCLPVGRWMIISGKRWRFKHKKNKDCFSTKKKANDVYSQIPVQLRVGVKKVFNFRFIGTSWWQYFFKLGWYVTYKLFLSYILCRATMKVMETIMRYALTGFHKYAKNLFCNNISDQW